MLCSENKELTKLTLQIGDCITSWEIPTMDCNAGDIFQGLYGLMVSQTFHPSTVISGMRSFVKENCDDNN